MQLRHRVALVTGGSIRIGQAIALALARRKAHVIISYRSSKREAAETLRQLRALGAKADAIHADVTNPTQIRALFSRIRRSTGRLDVLVNNAAVFRRTPFETLTEADWDFHLDANVKGPFLCALAASRLMRVHGVGKIINIADWAGVRPYRDYLPYCVSKAGVIGLTKALAKELAPAIQVIGIAPGPMLPPSDMSAEERARVVQRVPLKRWGSPQDIAKTVVFAIEGTDFMTGSTIFVDGGQVIA